MTPSLVLFAIQSALKLSDASKNVYIDSAHNKAITLPLLNVDLNADTEVILNIYRRDGRYNEVLASGPPLIIDLVKKNKYHRDELTTFDKQKLVQYHRDEDFNLDDKANDAISGKAFNAFLTIQQYSKSSSLSKSVFKRMGGAFLEVGIDYFAHAPNGFNVDSREAIALKALFIGLDHVEFSDDNWKAGLSEFPRRLSVALLETVSSKATIFSGDVATQRLISDTASTLSDDVKIYFDQIQQDLLSHDKEIEKQNIMSWGELVFRSVLNSAGKIVSENPQTYLGVNDKAEINLVKELSSTLLGIILDTETGELGTTFSKQSLDKLVKTTLVVISKHPELATNKKKGVKTLISEIAQGLSDMDTLINRDIFPETIRLIIEKSGENIEELWPESSENGEKHVLMVATKELFGNLSTTSDTHTWKLVFSKDDLLLMLDTTLKEVAKNPAWVINDANQQSQHLGIAVKAMLDVISGVPKQKRIDSKAGRKLIQTGLRAVAIRLEFLDKLPDGRNIIGGVYDAILTSILQQDSSSKAAWRLARADMLHSLVEVSLEKLQDTKITEREIKILGEVLNSQIAKINNSTPWSLESFAHELKNELSKEIG